MQRRGDTQNSLRRCFDRLARAYLRDLNILDLPEVIPVHILEFEGADFPRLGNSRLLVPGGGVWGQLGRHMLQPTAPGLHLKRHGLGPTSYHLTS